MITAEYRQWHFEIAKKLCQAIVPEMLSTELLEKAFTYTTMYKGEITAIGGVQKCWPGVGTAFLWALPAFVSYPIASARTWKKIYQSIAEGGEFHRIEATVEVDDDDRVRFLKFLGFEYEGLMRKYSPEGYDHLRYVWIP